jgi:hypothetical protein
VGLGRSGMFMQRLFERLIALIYFLGLLAFCAMCLVYVVDLVTEGKFEGTIIDHPGLFSDFRSYYSYGKLALSSERSGIVDYETQERWFDEVGTPKSAERTRFPYIPYAPFFAVFIAPISMLPMDLAYVVWFLGTMLCGILSLLLIGSAFAQRTAWQSAAILLGVSVSLPVWRGAALGQTCWLMTCLLACFFWAWYRKRYTLSGIILAVCSFKPQLVIFLIVAVLAARNWRILKSAILVGTVLFGLSISIFGSQFLPDMARAFLGLYGKMHYQFGTMLCARALFNGVLPHQIELLISSLIFIAGLAGLARLWWHNGPELDQTKGKWLICTTILVSLVCGPYVQLYDALLLAIVAVITLREVNPIRASALPNKRFKLWTLIFIAYPIVGWLLLVALGKENDLLYHAFTIVDVLLLFLVIKFNLSVSD